MALITTTSPSTPALHLLSVIIFVFVFHMIYFSMLYIYLRRRAYLPDHFL
jgi:hypothetical protein